MSLLKKIPTILGAGGGSVPAWRQHLQPCEWLQSDGNSCILLDIVANDITYFETDLTFYTSDEVVVFGVDYGSNKKLQFYYQSKWTIRWFTGLSITSNVTDTNVNVYLSNNLFKVNTWTNSGRARDNSVPYKIAIFGQNSSGTLKPNVSKFKNFKTNLCNLIAAYVIDEYVDNKATLCTAGVPGMVDIETGVFYTNDGTGNFTHGADINI